MSYYLFVSVVPFYGTVPHTFRSQYIFPSVQHSTSRASFELRARDKLKYRLRIQRTWLCRFSLSYDPSFPLQEGRVQSVPLYPPRIVFACSDNHSTFLLSAPGVVTITFSGVMTKAPFAVAAPLNIFSTIALKVSTT